MNMIFIWEKKKDKEELMVCGDVSNQSWTTAKMKA